MTDKSLAIHFHDYFSIHIADTIELKKEVFKLRCDVYCKELGYEKTCNHPEFSDCENCEIDIFDAYSKHILIQHKTSGKYAGCVRLVTPPPDNPKALLPFEANCSQSFEPKNIAFLREGNAIKVGEVSRLAVASQFRLRKSDTKSPEGINTEQLLLGISKEQLRYFPLISVVLYFAATSIAVHQHLKYAAVMMEPALARLLSRSGISFKQLGEPMDYHGQRALFFSDGAFLKALEPDLLALFQDLNQQLKHNLN